MSETQRARVVATVFPVARLVTLLVAVGFAIAAPRASAQAGTVERTPGLRRAEALSDAFKAVSRAIAPSVVQITAIDRIGSVELAVR